MNSADNQIQSSKARGGRTGAIRVGGWFAGIGGLAIPLALWAIMATSMSLFGADVGLKVGVLAESFLTMAWPTSVVLIAPGQGIGVVTALLVINVVLWGVIGFISEKIILRPVPYYGLLTILMLGLFISNGNFIWIAIESSKLALNLINVPTYVVAAIAAATLFILRRRRALSRNQTM